MLESVDPSQTTPDQVDPAEEQTDEQKELSKKLEELFQKARRARKPREARWDENFEFYLGKQWPYRRPSYRHSEVLNFTFAAIESIIPILTDNKPQISFIPEDVDDRDLADAITKIADGDWTREGWSYVLADVIKVGLIYGTSIGCMEFDPKDNGGLGRIKFENTDLYTVFPAPRARDINDGSCPYFIHAEPIPTEEAKAMFPDIAHLITGAGVVGFPSRFQKTDFDTTLNASAVRSNEVPSDPFSQYTTQEGKQLDMCLLSKFYMQDETMEEVQETTTDKSAASQSVDPNAPKMFQKKYPNGRYVVKVDDLIAFDGENPYDDGKYPYARWVDYQIPYEFWGMGEIDQLKSPQKIVNRLMSFMMDTIVLMGNPIWIADQGAIDTDQVTNQPGLIVEKQKDSNVIREPGVGIPSNFMSVYDLATSAYDRIFGQGEISQGTPTGGITAGSAIDSLQEAAQTRLRQKARNLEKFLQEIGTMYLSRVMQFYSTPRLITLSSDAAPALTMKQFKFQIQKNPDPTAQDQNGKSIDAPYIAHVQEITPQDNGPAQEGPIKKFGTKGIFDVRASVGSNLPFAKKAKADTAITLFKLGALTVKRLLEDLDYPNADKIVEELQQQQQAQAQAQAQPKK